MQTTWDTKKLNVYVALLHYKIKFVSKLIVVPNLLYYNNDDKYTLHMINCIIVDCIKIKLRAIKITFCFYFLEKIYNHCENIVIMQ